jgi:hypothetical protein
MGCSCFSASRDVSWWRIQIVFAMNNGYVALVCHPRAFLHRHALNRVRSHVVVPLQKRYILQTEFDYKLRQKYGGFNGKKIT